MICGRRGKRGWVITFVNRTGENGSVLFVWGCKEGRYTASRYHRSSPRFLDGNLASRSLKRVVACAAVGSDVIAVDIYLDWQDFLEWIGDSGYRKRPVLVFEDCEAASRFAAPSRDNNGIIEYRLWHIVVFVIMDMG